MDSHCHNFGSINSVKESGVETRSSVVVMKRTVAGVVYESKHCDSSILQAFHPLIDFAIG